MNIGLDDVAVQPPTASNTDTDIAVATIQEPDTVNIGLDAIGVQPPTASNMATEIGYM